MNGKILQTSPYKIVVSSVPKSGTHFLLQFFYFLREYLSPISATFKNESHAIHGWVDSHLQWHLQYLPKLSSGSRISGHLVYPTKEFSDQDLRREIIDSINGIDGFRAIYLFRDPRDAFISYVNMIVKDAKLHNNYRAIAGKTFKEILVRSLVNEREMRLETKRQDWFSAEVYDCFGGWLDDNNTLSVKYENLIGNLGGQAEERKREWLKKILAWTGLDFLIYSELFDELCDYLNEPQINTAGHFNKGTTQQWKTVFDDELCALFELYFPGVVESMGYSW